MGDRTCAACDGPLGGSLICVAVGGKPVEVCSCACAEALNEACVAGPSQSSAMSGQQAALTVRSIETPFGRISYAEAGSGAVALFVHGMLLNKHFWRHQLAGSSIFVAVSPSIYWRMEKRKSSRIKTSPAQRTPTC